MPKLQQNKLKPLDVDSYRDSLGDGTRKYRGLTTGALQVDELLSGLEGLVLMAGRSGVGKTTLATQLALGVAKKTPVLIYSLEMGKNSITTMLVQILARGLYRDDIELRGNSKDLDKDKKKLLGEALEKLDELAPNIFVRDASDEIPEVITGDDSVLKDVEALKVLTNSKDILVVVDSVQDIIPMTTNQVTAEVQVMTQMTQLQQTTGATILLISQKNKSSGKDGDSYSSVKGSMNLIHKPSTVFELVSTRELAGKSSPLTDDDEKVLETMKEIEDTSQSYAILLNMIKGRYTKTSHDVLEYVGHQGYYKL